MEAASAAVESGVGDLFWRGRGRGAYGTDRNGAERMRV